MASDGLVYMFSKWQVRESGDNVIIVAGWEQNKGVNSQEASVRMCRYYQVRKLAEVGGAV